MSILSECLDYFVKKKGQNIAELAKKCRIDRSTMYQYIRGKRSLQNQELFENILAELRLTPEERLKAIQAFEVTQIGEEKYYQREKVKELFDSLLTLEESRSYRTFLKGAGEFSLDGELFSDGWGSRMLCGEVEVQKGINRILQNAIGKGEDISLFLQPACTVFLYTINAIYTLAGRSTIRHIICLNSNSAPGEWDALEMVKTVMRCGVALGAYCPFYYYGIPTEHYGMMNLLPYFIIAGGFAVQIAVDGKTAIVHRDPEIYPFFQETFERMMQLCYPLMKSKTGLDKRLSWGMDYTKDYNFRKTIEVSSGLCSLQFWKRELIQKYLNPAIPGYTDLLEGMACYTAELYEVKKKGDIFILMNARYVLDFIQTGVFKEYPTIFFVSPLDKKDRKYLLEQIFRAMEEGWYHVCFLDEKVFPLDYRWETVAHQDGKLYMQYCINDQFRIFEFEIPEVSDAIFDYFQNLSMGKSAMGEEESRELLRRWMKEYLD